MISIRKRPLVLIALLLAATALHSTARAQTGSLKALKARYSKINSVHLVAQASVWIAFEKDQPGLSGVLSFEYWADRSRYRVKCSSDPALGLVADMEIAFDGTYWQMLDVPNSILHYQRSESRQMPVACPNPLFMPLDFLSPDGDDCRACGLRLGDIRDDFHWRNARRTPARLEGATGDTALQLEGSLVDGKARTYRIRFSQVSGVPVLTSLRRLDSSGRVDTEIVAEDFRIGDASVGPLPLSLAVKSFDHENGGRLAMAGTWKITEIEINQAVEDGVFTLDPNSVDAVWDGDTGVFLKHPDDRVLGRSLKAPRE